MKVPNKKKRKEDDEINWRKEKKGEGEVGGNGMQCYVALFEEKWMYYWIYTTRLYIHIDLCIVRISYVCMIKCNSVSVLSTYTTIEKEMDESLSEN